MKVLCVTEHSDRPEAETFIALHRMGVSITVICLGTAPYIERIKGAGVETIEYRFKGRIDRDGVRFLRRLINERGFDIMHMFNNRTVSNGVLASYGRKIRLIAYRGIVGNVSYLDPASWMTYLNPRVDRIVCVANAIRDYFHRMTLLGLPLPVHKALTIHKGHDLSWYVDEPVSLQQFGIPEGAFTIGCTANDRPRKGLVYLTQAMQHLKAHDDIHLLLVGHMDAKALQARVRDPVIRSRIHLTGYRADAPRLIASCQTAVLPAIKREGLPKVIIEAMAYRVPPIVTDSGGSPELIVDGESGFIVPVKDSAAIAQAITRLYRDEDLRRRMGKSARLRIDKDFNHRETVRKTLALYQELMGT